MASAPAVRQLPRSPAARRPSSLAETRVFPELAHIPAKGLVEIAGAASADLIVSLQRSLGQCEELLGTRLTEQQQLGVNGLSATLYRMLSVVRNLHECAATVQNAEWTIVDCNAVLRSVCEDLRDVMCDTGAHVHGNDLPRIHGIEPAIALILKELIGNSINYRSADAPEIHVEATRCAEGWRFSVDDNGIGFDRRNEAALFDPFYTVDPRAWRPGLGLAVARAAVSHLGGRIWAEGNERGGSRFFFTIPCRLVGSF